MNAFRDALRVVAKDALGLRDNFFGEQSDPVVDAILASPEMQAIKRIVREDISVEHWCCAECRDDYLDRNNIPASLVEWVMS